MIGSRTSSKVQRVTALSADPVTAWRCSLASTSMRQMGAVNGSLMRNRGSGPASSDDMLAAVAESTAIRVSIAARSLRNRIPLRPDVDFRALIVEYSCYSETGSRGRRASISGLV